jgi:hypothetical protein
MMATKEESIELQLESLVKLGPWLKTVIAGAFILGGWVTSLQFQVTALNNQMKSFEDSRKEREDKFSIWKEEVIRETADIKAELKGAREDIGELKASIDRLRK